MAPVTRNRSSRVVSELGTLIFVGLLGTATSTAATAAVHHPVEHTSGQRTAGALAVPLNSLVCVSHQKCVAVGSSGIGALGSSIAATTSDGGSHWATSPRLGGVTVLTALACSTMRICIAVGSNPVGNDQKGVVIRTLDEGHTWTVVPALPKRVGLLSSVSCPTSTFCMAVGQSPDGFGGVGLVSNSSGLRWKQLSLPEGERNLNLVACSTRRNCLAEGNSEAITGVTNSGERLSIIMTRDSGSTWMQRPFPATNFTALGYPSFKGMQCPSPTRCLMVGDATPGDGSPSGLILGSADDGKTWTFESVPPGTTFLNGVSCANATTCVVVGGGIEARGGSDRDILTTGDGGRTWTSRPVPPSAIGLDGVSCPTVHVCVAAGFGLTNTSPSADRSVVAVSSDGGATWTATH